MRVKGAVGVKDNNAVDRQMAEAGRASLRGQAIILISRSSQQPRRSPARPLSSVDMADCVVVISLLSGEERLSAGFGVQRVVADGKVQPAARLFASREQTAVVQ